MNLIGTDALYVLKRTVMVLGLILLSSSARGQAESSQDRVNRIIEWSKGAHQIDVAPIQDSLELAIRLSKKNGSHVLQAKAYEAYMKFLLEKTRDFDSATDVLEKINTLSKKGKKPRVRSIYHMCKGRLFMHEDANREKGKEQFRLAIEILEKNNLPVGFSLLNNYGIVEMEDARLTEALTFFDKSEKAFLKNKENKDKDFLTILRMNQGLCYIHMEKMDSAEYFFQLAIDNAETTPPLGDDFSSNLFMGIFLQEELRNDESISFLLKSFEIRDQVLVDFGDKALMCTGLAEAYYGKKEFEKAYAYRNLEIAYLDSVRQKGISEKAFAIEYKSEILALKQQKKIEALNSKVKEQSYRSRIGLITFLLILVTLSGSFILYRVNKRRQLNKVLAENERLDKERIRQESELEIFRREEKLISANVELSARKNELSSLKGRLIDHLGKSHDPEFDDLKKFLNQLSSSEKRSEQLQYIDHVLNYSNNEFYQRVKELHPNLTDDEMRMATLVRLNLSSKEIEQVFNISNSSLMTKRYRFRKKINLDKSQSLEDYLKGL